MARDYKEKFIDKSKSIYGDRFDYGKVVWEGNKKPVTLICKKHNIEFTQTPALHYYFNGCPECSKEYKGKLRSLSIDEFKERVKKIHGDSISVIEYESVSKPIKYRCNIHNVEFSRGCGNNIDEVMCPLCRQNSAEKEEKRIKKEKDFIKKANEIHKGAYDYSNVKYIDAKTKVEIFCKKHNKYFWQTPNHHLHGEGCKECGLERTIKSKSSTTKEFIEKAQKKHGDKYDYSKVNYSKNTDIVTIICPIHGEFKQQAAVHLMGCGCQKCAQETRNKKQVKTQEEFIKEAKEIHGNYYDYSKVVYKGRANNVIITCPIHGDFMQKPCKHLIGHGCPECGGSLPYSTEDYIEKAKSVHGDKYDYSLTDYINNRTFVKIICHAKDSKGNEHGVFEQEAASHLSGHGCPKCSLTISKAEDEILAFIKSKLKDVEVIKGDRKILNGKEIDIFIPSLKIGFEYNGVVWHSEKFGKDKNYHLEKMLNANKKGIKLYQIFEDEYIFNKNIVLSKIKHLIHKDEDNLKIMARKCLVKEIKRNIAIPFLEENHIQGASNSSIYIGAFYNDKLIGVTSFRKELKNSQNWELTRFSIKVGVRCIGLCSKMFSFFVRKYKPYYVKSFADRRWTQDNDNNLYTKIGFKLSKILDPEYRYYVQKTGGVKRFHKFNMRKQLLIKRYPDVGLTPDMTEKEMCDKLGFYRIWDCGLLKYEWVNEN